MNIIIAGGGKLAYFLCRAIQSKGHKVILINSSYQECKWLARHLKAIIVHGDAGDPKVLKEAGIEGVDQVLAVTSKDEDNLVICQLADLQFKVPRSIAIVNDPDHAEVFKRLGVTAVSPIRILSSIIEERAHYDQITNLIPISEGKVNLTEVELSASAPVVGKSLLNLKLPSNTLIAIILRNDKPIVPGGTTVLEVGDRLFVITLPENHGISIKLLTGEK